MKFEDILKEGIEISINRKQYINLCSSPLKEGILIKNFIDNKGYENKITTINNAPLVNFNIDFNKSKSDKVIYFTYARLSISKISRVYTTENSFKENFMDDLDQDTITKINRMKHDYIKFISDFDSFMEGLGYLNINNYIKSEVDYDKKDFIALDNIKMRKDINWIKSLFFQDLFYHFKDIDSKVLRFKKSNNK